MESFDIQRLLEEKWRSLRHVETERHWILAAYAVVIAGLLVFLAPRVGHAGAYLALGVLGIAGWLHAMQAAWQLGQIQLDLRRISEAWEGNDRSGENRLKRYWGFDTEVKQFRPGFSEFVIWLISIYFGNLFRRRWRRWRIFKRNLPTFSSLYIWLYTLAVIAFGLLYCNACGDLLARPYFCFL